MCKRGDVVWAYVEDEHGRNDKTRPVILLSSTEGLDADDLIPCVAVTGELPDPLPDHFVELPWENGRHPMTSFYKRCAAACHWMPRLKVSGIDKVRGRVSLRHLRKIEYEVSRNREA